VSFGLGAEFMVYLPLVQQQSVVITLPVCAFVCVCLYGSDCLSVIISQEPHVEMWPMTDAEVKRSEGIIAGLSECKLYVELLTELTWVFVLILHLSDLVEMS